MTGAALASALALLAASPAPLCPAWSREREARLPRVEARLVALVNEARRARGAPPVALEPRLSDLARAHSEHMARLRQLAHVLAGHTLEDRLRAADIHDWDAVGENIAMGPSVNYVAQTPRGDERSVACHDEGALALELFRAWLASPGHRRTLENPDFTHVGSGAAWDPVGEVVYVTHDFARLVSCGYGGAPCCPPPAGARGGVCQLPYRCLAGVCASPAPPPSPAAAP